MKTIHLLLIVLFACTLGLSTVSQVTYAASDKKVVTASTDKAKTTTASAKKEIPHDVDINIAGKELLTRLPGIGPVTAEAILKYRQDNGQFKNIDELTKVKGIGGKTLAKLRPYLHTI